jgi:hypothetical protein
MAMEQMPWAVPFAPPGAGAVAGAGDFESAEDKEVRKRPIPHGDNMGSHIYP